MHEHPKFYLRYRYSALASEQQYETMASMLIEMASRRYLQEKKCTPTLLDECKQDMNHDLDLLDLFASGVARDAAKVDSKMSEIDIAWCDWDRSSLLAWLPSGEACGCGCNSCV